MIVEKLTIDDLTAGKWILREDGSGTRAAFVKALGALGVPYGKLNIAIELPSNEAVLEAVLAGAGATILSARVCVDVIKAGTLYACRRRGLFMRCSMLTAIALVQFRRYWKSFAHAPHCDFSLPARAYTSSVFHSSPHPPPPKVHALVDLSLETIG